MTSETPHPTQLSQQHLTPTTPAPAYISLPARQQYDPEKGSPIPNAITPDGGADKRKVTLFGKQYTKKAVIITMVVVILCLIFILGLGLGLSLRPKLNKDPGPVGNGGGSFSPKNSKNPNCTSKDTCGCYTDPLEVQSCINLRNSIVKVL